MVEQDELLDLVDARDEVVGTSMREVHHANHQAFTTKQQYFRGTACLLVNSHKKAWIPTRQMNRKVAPGALDFSMAEHVQSGESHIEAAVRGMKEELNLEVDPSELELVGKEVFDDFGCLMSLYLYKTDTEPDFSTDDYQFGQWLSLPELEEKIASGVSCKSGMPRWLSILKARGL